MSIECVTSPVRHHAHVFACGVCVAALLLFFLKKKTPRSPRAASRKVQVSVEKGGGLLLQSSPLPPSSPPPSYLSHAHRRVVELSGREKTGKRQSLAAHKQGHPSERKNMAPSWDTTDTPFVGDSPTSSLLGPLPGAPQPSAFLAHNGHLSDCWGLPNIKRSWSSAGSVPA